MNTYRSGAYQSDKLRGLTYFEGSYKPDEIRLGLENILEYDHFYPEWQELHSELEKAGKEIFLERYTLIIKNVQRGELIHRIERLCIEVLVDIESEEWICRYVPVELEEEDIEAIKKCIIQGIKDEIECNFPI